MSPVTEVLDVGARPLAIGHRGAPTVATENTMPSIDAAIDAGADLVEIDVRLTRDGAPVLLHDRTLKRLWGKAVDIGDLELADLPGRAAGREPLIPTLREALEHVKGRGGRLLIDITSVAEGVASASVVSEMGLAAETALTGDPDGLAEVRARLPDAVIAMTWTRPGLPGAELLAQVRPQYHSQHHEWLSPAVVDAAHAAGLRVSAWTVDDQRRMGELAGMGVDAITSNEIALLVATLTSR
jgi:glycerophosphoryl diester phosphodiesterase